MKRYFFSFACLGSFGNGFMQLDKFPSLKEMQAHIADSKKTNPDNILILNIQELSKDDYNQFIKE